MQNKHTPALGFQYLPSIIRHKMERMAPHSQPSCLNLRTSTFVPIDPPENIPRLHIAVSAHALFVSCILSSLILLPPYAAEMMSFEYPDFRNFSGICLEGNVSIEGTGAIQQNVKIGIIGVAGRAYYCQPILVWNATTRELANFTTTFTFGMEQIKYAMGGGLAFFLSDDPNVPPYYLGLVNNSRLETSDRNRFVAVEFDCWNDDWDPVNSSCHVGIDLNSLESVAYVEMGDNTTSANPQGKAQIIYNSATTNLSASLYYNETLYEVSHIVDLRNYLPQWVYVGFMLATDLASDSKNITSWRFEYSNLGAVPQESPSPTITSMGPIGPMAEYKNNDGSSSDRNIGILVAAITAPLLVIVIGVSCFAIWKWNIIKPKSGSAMEMEPCHETGVSLNSNLGPPMRTNAATAEDCYVIEELEEVGPRCIPFKHLAAATENFSDRHKLGKGGFGGVYHGFLRNLNREAAIKRISEDSKQGIKEFISEVKVISMLRHRNLVQLFGWCHEDRELLLVYEFMPNGSLDYHLFNDDKVLLWPRRYNIALGLASALHYLHEGCAKCIVHRDIKPSNIMLDGNFNAKLGDFGLARVADHGSSLPSTIMAGTMGYMAPEYFTTHKASKETDVYSFGVVALEIACGRRAMEPRENGKEILIYWLWGLYEKGRVADAADKKLQKAFDKKEMETLILVGMWCAHPQVDSRPSLGQVITALNFEAAVPNLNTTASNIAVLPHVLSFSASSSTATGKSSDD